jgi:hypothetical protein
MSEAEIPSNLDNWPIYYFFGTKQSTSPSYSEAWSKFSTIQHSLIASDFPVLVQEGEDLTNDIGGICWNTEIQSVFDSAVGKFPQYLQMLDEGTLVNEARIREGDGNWR